MWLLYQFFQFSILHTGNDVQCSCCAVETGEPNHSGEGICWVPSEFVWGCCHICIEEAEKAKYHNHAILSISLSLSPYGYMSTRVYPLPPSCKGYHLVLTGHSLGAGVASLLAVLFKPKHPTLHCYAYSPPGCVIRYCNYKLTIMYHANSPYHVLLHGTHVEWSLHILPYPHSQTLYLRLMQSLICCIYAFELN